MLRKMCDEDMAGRQFWLFRIALRPGIAIEPRYRDENTENASQITQAELEDWNALRYLNVRESPGSVSLAIRPRTLQETQRVRLPLQALPSLMRMIAQIRDRIAHIEATRQDKPDATEWARHRREALMLRMQGAPEEVTPARDPTPEQHALEEKITEIIARRYLPRGLAAGTGPVLRRDVPLAQRAGPGARRRRLHRKVRRHGRGADPPRRRPPHPGGRQDLRAAAGRAGPSRPVPGPAWMVAGTVACGDRSGSQEAPVLEAFPMRYPQ